MDCVDLVLVFKLVLSHLGLLLDEGCRHLVQLALRDGGDFLDGLIHLGAELVDEVVQPRVLGGHDFVEARPLGMKPS